MDRVLHEVFISSCKIDSPALLDHHSTTLELAVHLHLLHLLITKVPEAPINGQAILLRLERKLYISGKRMWLFSP